MRRTIILSAIIISLTAAISIGLWLSGYPPEKEGLSDAAIATRAKMSTPLFWAFISSFITTAVIWAKRNQLNTATGKPLFLAQIGSVTPALAILLLQILILLKFYGLLDEGGSNIVFFYFIAAFFMFAGNYIVTVPFQSRMGFRTQATLSDATIWARTHRFLGRSLMLAALISLPLPLLIDGQYAQWILIGMVFFMKALTWRHARHLAMQISLRHSQ